MGRRVSALQLDVRVVGRSVAGVGMEISDADAE